MSYSRWSNSRWYTFWTSFSGDTKESQAFEIMIDFARTRVFTYEELVKNIDECLSEIQELCSNPIEYRLPREIITEEPKKEGTIFDRMTYVTEISEPDPATAQEMEELKVYMENFIADVECNYSIPGKFSDYLIGANVKIVSRFGWWLKHKIQPKRKKYAGRNSEV
jgi:hypothetical protein